MAAGTSSEGTSGDMGMAAIQARMTSACKSAESDEPTANMEKRENEDEGEEEIVAVASEVRCLVLCRGAPAEASC